MKKIKFYGNYTAEAVKTLKAAHRLICRVGEDGDIFVTDGCTAYKMNPLEYAAIVQPVACCEAGNWSILDGEKRDEPPVPFDLVKVFREAVQASADCTDLAPCPLAFTTSKGRTASTYYNAERDFSAIYDARYIASLLPGFTLRASNGITAAVAYRDGEPFAMILPIKPDEQTTRAIKAYFTRPDEAGEADELRAELAGLREKLAAAETGAAALSQRVQQQAEELEALRSASSDPSPAAAEPAADAMTAAEIIAARFSGFDGVTATIKGAQTTAPVIWLSGDTDRHADALKAAGAKWSSKKSAYYVRVA